MSDFDPYHIWLGISETARPVSKYRLLAIDAFEDNRDVISAAAERQTVYLRTLQAGEHAVLVAQLLNEVSQARVTLLNADQKAAYDEELLKQLTPEPEAEPTPVPIPVVQTPPLTPVVVRGTVTQEFPVSVVQSAKRPRRRKQKQIWKRPVVIGVSVVGVIGVLALFISLMFSGDADPVASNTPPVVTSPPTLAPEAEPAPQPEPPPTPSPQPDPTPQSESESEYTVRTLTGHKGPVTSVVFGPNGKTLTSGSDDGTIRLWDWTNKGEIRTLEGHTEIVHSVAFNSDGKTIASGSKDNTIKLWDVTTGTELRTLSGHVNYLNSVAFSPDGETLASGSFDTTIKLWNGRTGTLLKTLEGHSASVGSVAFSPDGEIIASGSDDNTIKLWSRQTGVELKTLTGHSDRIHSVTFSPDGKTLASGSFDNTIQLWELDAGVERKTLIGHSDNIWGIAFSPDGKTIASGSWDNTIKLWDVDSGLDLKTLVGHSFAVLSVAFSPDGKTLASGSSDKTIKLWDLESVPAPATANTLPSSLQQGLVAYYPFNGNAQDESGNGNHGEVHGAIIDADRYGNESQAYSFDGSNDYIAASGDFPQGSSPRSLTFWARPTEKPGSEFIVGWGKSAQGKAFGGFAVHEGSRNGIFFYGHRVDFSANFSVNSKWHQYSIIHNGQLILFFVDGNETARRSAQNINTTGNSLIIGARIDLEHPFTGPIDDIRIYDRALSEAEVKSLYDYESKPPASSTPTAPATESITNTVGMTLNKIPAGTFVMGSPEDEEGRKDDEYQHKVTITKPFYMQSTEVTQGQWKEVMGTEPWKGKQYVKEGSNNAATYVSWNDAVAFCKKLSEREGKTYCLPTEAEWEHACRAGTETRWSFGDDEKALGDYAWYKENAGDIGEKYAHRVGRKKPNRFGLHDMHGNIWEWCHDFYGENYYQRSPEKDPQGPALSVFYGVGRGPASRVTLVPLTAVGSTLIFVTTTKGFGWFVSWISSVVSQRPIFLARRPAGRGHGTTNT
jgi:WD40 repeat protein/formylglycine-generating enzyme required for sulfatase activity